eukprot:1725645-Rhodomonas_salina.1
MAWPVQNDTFITPLATAARWGYVEVVKKLLAGGADKTVETKDGTALERARKHVEDQATLAELVALLENLHEAAKDGDTEAMGRLIEA